MKKLFVTLGAVFLIASSVLAQDFKVAYCNIEFVLAKLPQMKQVESELQSVQGQFEKEIQTLYTELQTKYQNFEQSAAMMSDIAKADKQKELQNLQNRIQLMENNAKMKIMQKQEELLEPILTNIEAKIQEVAKEKGYVYVLNQQTPSGSSIILYAKNDSDNITLEVLKKLGVQLTPAEIEAAKQ